MQYTFKLFTNPVMSDAENAFVTGFLQAIDLSSSPWTDVAEDTEIPEVCICTNSEDASPYSAFCIRWLPDAPAMTTGARKWMEGPCGTCTCNYTKETHYFQHEKELSQCCTLLPESKGFFPSLRQLYSTDTPDQLGYAVGCMLDDIMLAESAYEAKEAAP